MNSLNGLFDVKLFKLGTTDVTLWSLMYIVILSFVLVRLSDRLTEWLMKRVISRSRINPIAQQAIGTTLHYLILTFGFIILLQSAGIDLSAITVVVGALGIGISFGLQQITSNLISGLIILFERSIKLGDKVQVGDVVGRVQNISLRATTVVTTDGVSVMVPNSEFITSKVMNYTLQAQRAFARFSINVPISKSLPQLQKEIVEIVSAHDGVLDSPTPQVHFEDATSDTAKFAVVCATDKFMDDPDALQSDLRMEIYSRFPKPTATPENAAENKAA